MVYRAEKNKQFRGQKIEEPKDSDPNKRDTLSS